MEPPRADPAERWSFLFVQLQGAGGRADALSKVTALWLLMVAGGSQPHKLYWFKDDKDPAQQKPE